MTGGVTALFSLIQPLISLLNSLGLCCETASLNEAFKLLNMVEEYAQNWHP